jgi:hypothetical protein
MRPGIQTAMERLVHGVQVKSILNQLGEWEVTMVAFHEFHRSDKILLVVIVQPSNGMNISDELLGADGQSALRKSCAH